MWKALALVACSASVIAVPVALASEGDLTQTQKAEHLRLAADDVPLAPAPTCTPIKQVYSERNWRLAHPATEAVLCPSSRAGRRNTIRHFYEYRHYRQIATMKCLDGREGYFVPNVGSCSTIECESHFNWWAQNPSGALWVYQLLGWGAPPPSSFHNRLRNHEIAATLGRSAWVC